MSNMLVLFKSIICFFKGHNYNGNYFYSNRNIIKCKRCYKKIKTLKFSIKELTKCLEPSSTPFFNYISKGVK